MHAIDEKYDRVFSLLDTWHGLDQRREVIGEPEFKELSHDIKEVELNPEIDGVVVPFENYKLLVADVGESRPDIPANERYVPLHIPKARYGVINNRDVIECCTKAFEDLGAKITTIGTLDRLKKFFITVDIGDAVQIVNKDRFECYVNFVTSHDGTMAMDAYDSVVRIVCMNTLIASRQAAGEVGFKAYHTKNAKLAMTGIADLFNAILKGRANLREVMEYLDSHKCEKNDAMAMAAGYFCIGNQVDEITTRTYNAACGITDLYNNGVGNRGQTLYDLANGATEYWTHGDGTGKGSKTTSNQKAYRANFGSAATHKEAFVAMLANDDMRSKAVEVGTKALADYLAS